MDSEARQRNGKDVPSSSALSFRYESELVATLLKHIHEFVDGRSSHIVATEVRVGAGIVDLLVAVPDVGLSQQRMWSKHVSWRRLSRREVLVLSTLDLHQARSIEDITGDTCVPPEQVATIVQELARIDHVEERGDGQFLRTESSTPFFKSMVSIEAKLEKWEVALRQAARNQLFSTASYVVLDASHSSRAIGNRDLFEKVGVGLATASAAEQSVKVLWHPPKPGYRSELLWREAMEALMDKVRSGEADIPKELMLCLSI